ncbi:MAG TPA: LamG-like jellyroll fold domain-containing protein [Ideonella sp.]|jgi:hypothetical protein|nr:LamG-like jellyroll fold domain-containing protein [Ideonella sp.]
MKALKLTAALFAASSMMVGASASDLNKGLMGLWHLDGDAHDASGNGHDGVVVGATVVPNGISGSAYAFDGNDRITVGNLDFSGERFTVNIWLQTDRAAKVEDWRMPINKADSSAINQTFQILLGDGRTPPEAGGNAPMMQVWKNAGGLVNEGVGSNSNINARDGSWHMATMTYTRGQQVLYVDGCPVSYGRYNGPLPLVPGEVAIGGVEGLVFHHPWIGQLDEVSIYSRELSHGDVLKLYRAFRPSGGCGSASREELTQALCHNLTASTSVTALISRGFWNCAGLATSVGDKLSTDLSGTTQ